MSFAFGQENNRIVVCCCLFRREKTIIVSKCAQCKQLGLRKSLAEKKTIICFYPMLLVAVCNSGAICKCNCQIFLMKSNCCEQTTCENATYFLFSIQLIT
jgi:hypothetical protein